MMNKIVSMYVAYVGSKGGKRRPVLIVENNKNEVFFYAITSKFRNKSASIKKFYFHIEDWIDFNLKKESWIDTGNLFILSKETTVFKYKDIGELSKHDMNRLEAFLEANIENN